MYNKDVADALLEKYGKESLLIYSKMEAERNKLMSDDFKERQTENDFSYDAEWWENKYNELLKTSSK